MRKLLLVPGFIFSFLFSGLAQQPAMQQKAITVKRMIELNHLSPRAVNDSFSQQMFRTIINAADRKRLLLTEPEFKSLQSMYSSLDDELNGGKWTFYDLFSSIYKKALSRADSLIKKLTEKPFNFEINESVSSQRKDVFNFSADLSSLAARWQRYMKYTALNQLFEQAADDTTGKTTLKTVIVQTELKTREWIRKTETRSLKRITELPTGIDGYITDLYLNALSTTFDPHTNYFSAQQKEEFRESLSTEALSFGIEFDENDKGQVVIDQLTPGGPAWKTGDLNKGDVLLSLLWEGKEVVDMTGATLEEAYEVIDKSSSDKLIMKVQKADGTVKQVLLRKEKMENEENIVKGFILEGEKRIGYILLPGFYTEWENETGSSCANDVAKEIVKLKKENIDGLILDVRFNGGGSLGESMEMLGIFIDEGPLLGIQSKEPKITYLKDPNRGTIYTGPLALMVNGQSASASEILAATLQDYNRAVIVGSNTFGKATMQRLFSLDTNAKASKLLPGENKDMVKITNGKLYRLTGETAQRTGVKPDVVLPDAFDGIEYREKFFQTALTGETITKNNYYKPLALLPLTELAYKSAARIKDNPDFELIRAIVNKMLIRNEKTETISLKWDEFEKWARQRDNETDLLTGEINTPVTVYKVNNHNLDKMLLANNEYAKESNQVWLENIGEDIYIQETFQVLCDLIKLR